MNSYQDKNKKIILKNINKYYDGNQILKDINLFVNRGELVSLVGPSGCGKSTIFNIITSLTSSDSGNTYVDGEISYMYQKDLLLPHKDILDNVSLPLQIKGISRKYARKEAEKYFEVFDLVGYETKYPSELSGGMKQRANFLRTYICSKDLMLLDEPFGALDSITKSSLQEWFLSVRKKVNSTILLITHDIDEAILLSDRIYVLSSRPASIKKEYILTEPDYNKKDLALNACLKKEILTLLK
ncbi:ABC transporter ATP-binding protein [Peptostreptococcus canis]|uniref:ABC transporter ATP-binding protein n=1 Tax=Peptostreptococcus canis TaxID=1159213 RepID=A0ABR6TJV9_9FIRM|nr:ABC transporter ATP-binding protein [Peptostreptococcus canis]MBC2575706.1 ABC transporter ATP-binding protein [Peptostreptococcus canis]MBP1998179.1 ABC-type nitrate/sulfonate/bicarbonate transport system ATPase subunit [Peptostreptococcus canis]